MEKSTSKPVYVFKLHNMILFVKFCVCIYFVTIVKCSFDDSDGVVLLKKILNNLGEIAVWRENKHSVAEVLFTSQFGVYHEELSYIMDMSCYSKDPLYVFQAIKTDLVMEKRQFKLLERALIEMVVGWYDGFDAEQRFRVDPVDVFYFEMAKFAGKRGYFDLIPKLLEGKALVEWYFGHENKTKLFKEHGLIIRIKETVSHASDKEIMKFVANCFVNQASIQIYESFLIEDSSFVIKMAPYLISSGGLNQFYYEAMNDLIQKYIWAREVTNTDVLYLSRIINMILYSELDLEIYENEISWREYERETLRLLAKIASNVGKSDIVAGILDDKRAYLRGYCKSVLKTSIEAFDVKPCFDILGFLPVSEVDRMLNDQQLFNVALNFSAVEAIKMENEDLIFLMKARESNWIESLKFELNAEILPAVLKNIWMKMKADHLASVLLDFACLNKELTTVVPSFEVIEALKDSDELQLLAAKANLKFEVSALDLLKTPGSIRTSLLNVVDLYLALHQAKDRKDFIQLEEYSGKSVADIILEKESELVETGGISEASYFALRPAFAYWKSGPERIRISEIKTAKIIELLKLE